MPDQIMPESRVVDALQSLATVCRDSQEGYRTAADETSDHSLKEMFLDVARQREQEADELDRLIQAHGERSPARTGSLTGQAHRIFVGLRAALTGNDRAAALREVARGESYAEAAFDRAKHLQLPGEAGDLVHRLHDSIRDSRDKVRRMAEAESGWAMPPGAQRYIDEAAHYVNDKPVASSLVALGIGFVIGALTVLVTRPANGGTRVRRADYEGPNAGI